MKLKEKLAHEYLDSHFISETEGYDLTEDEIFLAGFEKARKMFLDHLKKIKAQPPYQYATYNEIYSDTIDSLIHTGSKDSVAHIGEE